MRSELNQPMRSELNLAGPGELNLAGLGERVSPRELYRDYGADVTTVKGSRRFWAEEHKRRAAGARGGMPAEDESLISARRYADEVRKVLARSRGNRVFPATLVALGAGCMPAERWAALLPDFWGYCRKLYGDTALMSLDTGSVAAWRAGIPAEDIVGRGTLVRAFTQRTRSGCPKIEENDRGPLLRLAYIHPAIRFPGNVSRKDLRRLSKVDQEALRIVMRYTDGSLMRWHEFSSDNKHGRLHWELLQRDIAAAKRLPRETLELVGAPVNWWMEWEKLDQTGRDAVVLAAELVRADRRLRYYAAEATVHILTYPYEGGHALGRRLGRVLKRGWVKRYIVPHLNNGTLSADGTKVGQLLDSLSRVPDGVLPPKTADAAMLLEWLESKGYDGGRSATTLEQHRLCRAYDRAAQRVPDWAVMQWGEEYTRGRKLAKLFAPALDFLQRKVEAGACVFVHGRDAEIIRELLRRRGASTRYGITSRSLTTLCRRPSPEFIDYLKRMTGTAGTVVHVDTGYDGSIPDWMKERGFPVSEVCMISATDPKRQIPGVVEAGGGREALRRTVVADIEHVPQRLHKPHEWCGGARIYSDAAPGFWARLYGVCDELGVPRTPPKGRKLRALKKRLKAAQKAGEGMSGFACLRGRRGRSCARV